jgi:GNAT superfamily N-acetyltransferase
MTIRQAHLSDLEQLSILFDGYRQFYQQPSDIEGARSFLHQRFSNKESVVFMAFENNEAVGFTQLYPIFSSVSLKKAWLLNDLFVCASARKKGVALSLLKAAEDHGKATGARWLLLETAHDNTKAQALYEKAGWERETAFYYRLLL